MGFFSSIFCTTYVIYFFSVPYSVQILPKGRCPLCCPINLREDVKFYLHSRPWVPGRSPFAYTPSKTRIAHNNKTTVLYIHGFSEQHTGPGATAVSTAYLKTGYDNVIVVDWSSLSALPWYSHSVANTFPAARVVAKFIDDLVWAGLPLHSLHVVGFSLGAEIAGLAGKMITTGKLSRITGLDPASPLYMMSDHKMRLDKTDAHFVDVVHTDSGKLGLAKPIGHADFYPNCEKSAQPGCRRMVAFSKGRFDELVACNHNRAWKYYAESIMNPWGFRAENCPSYGHYLVGICPKRRGAPVPYMGYMADTRLRGNFFLRTNSEEPYGRGWRGLRVP